MTPMILPRSSSSEGSVASALIALASSVWPESPPPTIVSLLLRLAYSTATLAAATGSREKAIAVGPVNSGASGSDSGPSRAGFTHPVLGYPIARAGVAHLPPQLGDLVDRQPGLMRDHDADRIGEILPQRFGHLLLLRSVHLRLQNPPGARPRPALSKTTDAIDHRYCRRPGIPAAGQQLELRSRFLGEACRIHLHRRTHRRAQADPLDVGALDSARLVPGDGADKGAHIIDQRVFRKARFADPGMHDAGFLGAELAL